MYHLIVKPFLFLFDPEWVHHLVFNSIKFVNKIPGVSKLLSFIYVLKDKRLEQNLFGLTFPNQVGLVFYIKNTCLGMETFANSKLWRTYSNKILKSIFIDAIEIERDAHRQMFQTVSTELEIYNKFYNFMKSLKERVIKGPYLGEEVVMNYPDLDFTASGINWEGSMIHLNAFQKIT